MHFWTWQVKITFQKTFWPVNTDFPKKNMACQIVYSSLRNSVWGVNIAGVD